MEATHPVFRFESPHNLCLATSPSGFEINDIDVWTKPVCYNGASMFDLLWLWVGAFLRLFRNRQNLLLENLALRQQLTVLKRKHRKPRLALLDKLFWVSARRLWPDWKNSLLLVTPETVVRWHRAGFRLYWTMLWMFVNFYAISFALRPLRVLRSLARAVLTGTEDTRYAKWFVDRFFTRKRWRKLADQASS